MFTTTVQCIGAGISRPGGLSLVAGADGVSGARSKQLPAKGRQGLG